MAGYLHYILSGIGAWGNKQRNQHLIQHQFTIYYLSEMDGMWFLFGQVFTFENAIGNTNGIRTR